MGRDHAQSPRGGWGASWGWHGQWLGRSLLWQHTPVGVTEAHGVAPQERVRLPHGVLQDRGHVCYGGNARGRFSSTTPSLSGTKKQMTGLNLVPARQLCQEV